MNNEHGGVHWSFWVISVVGLLWNILGVVNFFVQMSPEMLVSYRESERTIVEGRPSWATAAFALAVLGGALGCLLLLFRDSAAFYLFIASFFGVVVTMIHALSLGIHFEAGEFAGIIILPLAVAAFLIWYTKYAARKGWVN